MLIPQKLKVLTIHNEHEQISSNILNYDKVFAISLSVKNNITTQYPLCNPIVISNGIVCSKIVTKLRQLSSLFKVVQIGRLVHQQKGQHVLIHAIKLLVDSYNVKNIRLSIIGCGKSEEYLVKLVNDLGLEPFVVFCGEQSREYVYEHLCDYDLLVQPSLSEGFGLTIVEAMAAKVPVLVSKLEGPMEVISQGKYGSYFSPGEAKECAIKIFDIMSNFTETLSASKIDDAYNYAVENYNIHLTSEKYCLYYADTFREINENTSS